MNYLLLQTVQPHVKLTHSLVQTQRHYLGYLSHLRSVHRRYLVKSKLCNVGDQIDVEDSEDPKQAQSVEETQLMFLRLNLWMKCENPT